MEGTSGACDALRSCARTLLQLLTVEGENWSIGRPAHTPAGQDLQAVLAANPFGRNEAPRQVLDIGLWSC
jgi:hypothetical protein